MKKELVVRRNIYTGKEHKLIWSGTGKLYYFQPAEEWMPIYLNYLVDEKSGQWIIESLDSDGFGFPLCVGDIVDDMEVAAIIEVDDKTCVMFK
jgi:hypothetical protein